MFGTRGFLFWFGRFWIVPGQAIGRAIKPRLTGIIMDLIGRIVGAGAAAGVADIVEAFLAGRAIYSPRIIILCVGGTTPVVQTTGEGAADADDNG
jgi:hypothetical protein